MITTEDARILRRLAKGGEAPQDYPTRKHLIDVGVVDLIGGTELRVNDYGRQVIASAPHYGPRPNTEPEECGCHEAGQCLTSTGCEHCRVFGDESCGLDV